VYEKLALRIKEANAIVTLAYSPGPVIWSVSPNFGPVGGGTPVNIRGANLTAAQVAQVRFGAVDVAGFVRVSDALITTTSPAQAGPGQVSIQLRDAALNWHPLTPGSANSFTYLP